MKTKPKKRKPTDSTMRNVKAANKRIHEHEMRICMLEDLLLNLGSRCWEACGADWAHDAKAQMLRLRKK